MKTIKLELSVKLLMGAIALGLFLNAFKDFPPKAYAYDHVQKVTICDERGDYCAHTGEANNEGYNVLLTHNVQ